MRWWRIKLPVGLLAGLCVAMALLGSGEGAPQRRARVIWTAGPSDCVRLPPGSTSALVCGELKPGEEDILEITFSTTAEVPRPRLVLQTPNGASVIGKPVTAEPLPDPIPADTEITVTLPLTVAPHSRIRRVSGRLYLAERGAVLVPPINIRVDIQHPTPEELALTPVIVPTNHIQIVPRPPAVVAPANAARFNVRHMTVRSGTHMTWTNRDAVTRAVRGVLCKPGQRVIASQQCTLDPEIPDDCLAPAGPDEFVYRAPDGDERLLCFISPELQPQGHYALTVHRPNRRQPLTYYMQDAASSDPDTMVEQFGQTRYRPYLTVK